jgi:hypothetical protein
MAYIGKQPVVGNFVKLDAITTSATATYNLLNGGVAYFPQTANNCIVSLNGVIQSPTSAYTISGSTIVFSDALTASDSIDFILVLGDVLSIGTPSDGTVTSAKLASGTTGLIAWQSVQTTGFTASAGRGYPCNTTSAAFTVTLPASPSVGDTIILLDYAGTFATNNITLAPNGNKINGSTDNLLLSGEREGATLTYIDSTQGWLASSGINEGTNALSPTNVLTNYLVIAGGGGGGKHQAGGGGAGGFRSTVTNTGGGGSLETALTLNFATNYTVTVGAGGAGTSTTNTSGTSGSNSVFSTITSTGGGGGSHYNSGAGLNGGSGGGAGGHGSSQQNGGTATANQGFNGGQGNGGGLGGGGGGGGAGQVGASTATNAGGNGGNGVASSITGSSVTYAGGGGGGGVTPGNGGSGGGGNGTKLGTAGSGTVNTGSGGGGEGDAVGTSGAGGSGIVILSYPSSFTITNSGGGLTFSTTTSGSNKITSFTAGTGTIQFN